MMKSRSEEISMKKTELLADAFDREMCHLYTTILRRCRYRANDLRKMVAQHGGVRTAKILLARPEPSSGFTELLLRGAVDLTVEAIVLQPRWRSLFFVEELAIAESRLPGLHRKAA